MTKILHVSFIGCGWLFWLFINVYAVVWSQSISIKSHSRCAGDTECFCEKILDIGRDHFVVLKKMSDFFLGFFTSSGVPQGRGLEPQRLYFSFFFFFHWLWIILNIFPSKHPHVWDEAIIFSLLLQKLLYGCKNWTKEQFNRRIKEKIISLLITCNKMAYLCKNILKV